MLVRVMIALVVGLVPAVPHQEPVVETVAHGGYPPPTYCNPLHPWEWDWGPGPGGGCG